MGSAICRPPVRTLVLRRAGGIPSESTHPVGAGSHQGHQQVIAWCRTPESLWLSNTRVRPSSTQHSASSGEDTVEEILRVINGTIMYHQGQLHYIQRCYGDEDPYIPPNWSES